VNAASYAATSSVSTQSADMKWKVIGLGYCKFQLLSSARLLLYLYKRIELLN
jgi:hypothetical protein